MGFLLFCLLVGAMILYPKLILKGIWEMIVGGAVIFGLIIILAIMVGVVIAREGVRTTGECEIES